MNTGLTNTHTARGFSDLYHVFARKQYILCPALSHGCLTLLYVTSVRDFFCPLEQSRTALLGCHLAASRLRETARWQLTNRCHVAMRPLSNRSQMTSKCEWLKQKSGTRAAGDCVTEIFTVIYVSVL